MSFSFHSNKEQYFRFQYQVTRDYIVPFLRRHCTIGTSTTILEIGCGFGGNLKAFGELGAKCIGVDINPSSVQSGNKILQKEMPTGNFQLHSEDMFCFSPTEKVDIVLLKDTLEHLHDHRAVLRKIKEFMKPNGFAFFAFPPWHMPFGGHQQIAKCWFINFFPYIHLLPRSLYKLILTIAREEPSIVKELLSLNATGISTSAFEKLAHEEGFDITGRQLYLINPIYEHKFKMKPTKQLQAIEKMRHLRDFVTTCAYYLVSFKE